MKDIFRKFLYLILASVMAVRLGVAVNAQPVYVLAQLQQGTNTRGLSQDTLVWLSLGGAAVNAKVVSICGNMVELSYDDNNHPERLPIVLGELNFTNLSTMSTYFCKLLFVSIWDLFKPTDISPCSDGLNPNRLLSRADL